MAERIEGRRDSLLIQEAFQHHMEDESALYIFPQHLMAIFEEKPGFIERRYYQNVAENPSKFSPAASLTVNGRSKAFLLRKFGENNGLSNLAFNNSRFRTELHISQGNDEARISATPDGRVQSISVFQQKDEQRLYLISRRDNNFSDVEIQRLEESHPIPLEESAEILHFIHEYVLRQYANDQLETELHVPRRINVETLRSFVAEEILEDPTNTSLELDTPWKDANLTAVSGIRYSMYK